MTAENDFMINLHQSYVAELLTFGYVVRHAAHCAMEPSSYSAKIMKPGKSQG